MVSRRAAVRDPDEGEHESEGTMVDEDDSSVEEPEVEEGAPSTDEEHAPPSLTSQEYERMREEMIMKQMEEERQQVWHILFVKALLHILLRLLFTVTWVSTTLLTFGRIAVVEYTSSRYSRRALAQGGLSAAERQFHEQEVERSRQFAQHYRARLLVIGEVCYPGWVALFTLNYKEILSSPFRRLGTCVRQIQSILSSKLVGMSTLISMEDNESSRD